MKAVVLLEQVCFSNPWSRRCFEVLLEDGSADVLLAKSENALVGYVIGLEAGGRYLIANLAVAPMFRRKGVAAHLLSRALEWGERRCAFFASLDVRESNLAAVRLYEKFGFRVIGRKKGYYSLPYEDSLVMVKALRPEVSSRPQDSRGKPSEPR